MPFNPGSPEWYERRKTMLLAQEAKKPLRWFYLSFAKPGKFLGGLYIEARGPLSAIQRSHELSLNPGGEVMILDLGSTPREYFDAKVPEAMRNRLLTRPECEQR